MQVPESLVAADGNNEITLLAGLERFRVRPVQLLNIEVDLECPVSRPCRYTVHIDLVIG